MIGVHSAKFDTERLDDNIRDAIQRYGILHPVVNDSGLSWWSKLGIRCWPTLVIIGPRGQVLKKFVGEGQMPGVRRFLRAALVHFKADLEDAGTEMPVTGAAQTRSGNGLKYPGKIVHVAGTEEADGRLFVADSSNHRVVEIHPETGFILETIGQTGKRGAQDGAFSQASFNSPQVRQES